MAAQMLAYQTKSGCAKDTLEGTMLHDLRSRENYGRLPAMYMHVPKLRINNTVTTLRGLYTEQYA